MKCAHVLLKIHTVSACLILKLWGGLFFVGWRLFEGGAYMIAPILQVIQKSKRKNYVTYSYLQAFVIAKIQRNKN